MKFTFFLFICFYASILNAQTSTNYNLNFETMTGGNLPLGWSKVGNGKYTLGLDSHVRAEGQYAVKINSSDKNESGFAGLMFNIPDHFQGGEMELSGWIKTENVTEGFAGLMIRIDPGVAFDNMKQQAVSGTREWRSYSIKVNLKPQSTKAIFLGVLLVGKGTAWFDDLHVKIDGKSYNEVLRQATPALSDTVYQYESKIKNFEASTQVTKRLKDLAQTWGFLKYRHPSVAKGLFNMDAELFRVMPEVIAPNNDKRRVDSAVMSLIKKLGELEDIPATTTPDRSLKMDADYTWIDRLDYSSETKEVLLSLAGKNFPLSSHYYLKMNAIGVPTFNEQNYPHVSLDDVGFRLLGVFRYWNIIQYYSPYRYLVQDKWDRVLEESIADMIEARTESDVSKALLRLFANTGDSHGMIFQNKMSLSDFYGRRIVPATVGFIEQKAVVLSLPEDDRLDKSKGLQVGDVIQSLNGTSVEERVNFYRPYTAASNEDGLRRNIARHLLCDNDTIVKIEINRNGHDTIILAVTYPVGQIAVGSPKKDSVFRLLDNNIGYVDHGLLTKADLPGLWNKIKACQGLVIDMRNYPKDFLVFDFARFLLDNKRPFAKFTRSTIDSAGTFRFTPNITVDSENPEFFGGPIVILVNETTQSSSEYHAMAYQQAPRAWTMGSQTAGADGNVALVQLPFDYKVLMTSLGVYYPDGGETQQVGIRIDQKVKPTLNGIRAGRDELLEKAIEYIRQQ